MTWDVSMPGLMILSEGALDRFLLEPEKRWISDIAFAALGLRSPDRGRLRNNVSGFGTRSVCRKTDEFPTLGRAALIGGFFCDVEIAERRPLQERT
jgi:hypothetical protein